MSLFAHFCVPLFTTCCKWQQLLWLLFLFTLFCLNNNNCSTELYNEDFQNTIFLFKHRLSLHKTDWIFTDSVPCFSLPCIWQRMKNLEDECSRLPLLEISINVNLVVSLLLFVYFCLHFFSQCLLLFSPMLRNLYKTSAAWKMCGFT